MDDTSNDNPFDPGPLPSSGPDAQGQAALLLVESLIHGLIARCVISSADAVEIVDVATDAREEIAFDLGDSPIALKKSLAILHAISASLRPNISPE